MKIQATAIPNELKELDQWVIWRYEQRTDESKPTKVPYVAGAPGRHASHSDPDTWDSFAQAYLAYVEGHADGIGFVFSEDDPYTGIDLDDCRNPDTGELDTDTAAHIEVLATYTEASPSGEGIHAIARATLPDGRRRSGNVEMYDRNRYFTFTGHRIEDTPHTIEARQPEVEALHDEVMSEPAHPDPSRPAPSLDVLALSDRELLDRARNAANGEKFKRLYAGNWTGYPSQSEADFALCHLLAFWTGKDAERIDTLFRQSGLMRTKWDRRAHSNGDTYGELTIQETIKRTTETYTPPTERTENENLANIIEAARAFVVRFDYPTHGIGKDTDKKIMLGFLATCEQTGKLEVTYSVRDAAEDAGCGRSAAGSALYRLCEYGLLQLSSVGTDRVNEANTYTLGNVLLRHGITAIRDMSNNRTHDVNTSVGKGVCPGVLHNFANEDSFLFGAKLDMQKVAGDLKRRLKRLQAQGQTDRRAKRMAEQLEGGVLGPKALQIIAALVAENGQNITSLEEITGMCRQTASDKAHFLAALGILDVEQQGRSVVFYLKRTWQQLIIWLSRMVTTFTRALRRVIEHLTQRITHLEAAERSTYLPDRRDRLLAEAERLKERRKKVETTWQSMKRRPIAA